MVKDANGARFDWALEVLPLTPDARVLEIGCGHGLALERVAARLARGTIVGLDRSAKMTALAAKRNAAAVSAGRVQLVTGALAHVPIEGPPFDLAFAINVRLFADDAATELEWLARHLRKKGALYLFFEAPNDRHAEAFAAGAEQNLRAHGFRTRPTLRRARAVCVAGALP